MVSDEQRWTQMVSMMDTPGWDCLIQEAQEQIYELQAAALEAKDFETICEWRGEARQLAAIVNFKGMIHTLIEDARREAAEDADL